MTKLSTKNMILVAIFAALTAGLTMIQIPLPFTPVPINLALFSVYLSGILIGSAKGALSQTVYLLLGAVGLPVFSKFQGGLSVLAGPTGGYLLGYVAAALVVGLILGKRDNKIWMYAVACVAGLVVCYFIGTAWFAFSLKKTMGEALALCVYPFLFGDALKITAATLLAKRLRILANV